jgi:hypothetical protein
VEARGFRRTERLTLRWHEGKLRSAVETVLVGLCIIPTEVTHSGRVREKGAHLMNTILNRYRVPVLRKQRKSESSRLE